MRALFVDANETLAAVTDKLLASQKLPVSINRNPSIKPDDLPGLLGDAEIMIVDHTAVPSAIAETVQGAEACRLPRHRRAQLHESGRAR